MRIFQIACCAAIVLVACAPANEAEPMACSSGFAPTGNALTFGSESSVELVKAIDAEWAKLDLGSMRQFYSDTCLFEWNDGDQFQGFDAFAAKLSGDTLDYSWNMIWAYCVDDDQEEPGDWVHAGFDEVGTFAGDTVEKVIIEEWYYIRDEKVQYYSNSKRPVR
jgi:hypothetical protein